MSFWLMIIILLVAAVLGGCVNYLLPENNPEPGKFIKPLMNCIILGLGASLMIPIFLEFAQSKLLDDINFDVPWKKEQGKNYLLWGSYCLLASAAGFKFINMLINNVVKQGEMAKKEVAITELKKEVTKRAKNSQINQQKEEQAMRTSLMKDHVKKTISGLIANETDDSFILPVLPPVVHINDPQKGRFGGKNELNHRKLTAQVTSSTIPGYWIVTLTVGSTDEKNPLRFPVIFYLHDSFTPSVYQVTPKQFMDGKAVVGQILSYGAFTVGIVTDNGNTLLELDLAGVKDFPPEFRER